MMFRRLFLCAMVLASLLGAQPSRSQQTDLDPAGVEQWADEAFGRMLAEYRFSAAAIAVTQGDHLVFAKGYGYADWPSKTPVTADRSQFRIASLTKTFTATAIAQLLEQGKIASLDDPANKYLKRTKLAKSFGQEITLWDLLNHRAGYENYPFDKGPLRSEVPASAATIAENTPKIARPRDQVSIYCNFCFAMLGAVVEDITGQRLQDYFQANIFGPLGMTNTLLSYSPRPTPDLATQYAFVNGQAPIPLYYTPEPPYMSPAGGINATADDMAKYMIAHINAGRGDGPALLKPDTFDLMHKRHAGNDPRTSGFGMAFFTYDYNGEPVIEHYGSLGYRDLMVMMLDRKIGVIVMAAGGGAPGNAQRATDAGADAAPIGGKVERQLGQSGMRALVLEHFLGPLEGTVVQADLTKYIGDYRPMGQTVSLVQSLPSFLSGNLAHVSARDGGLIIAGRGVFRPNAADVFTLDHTLELEAPFGQSNRYVFVTNASGQAARFYGHVNAGGFERVSGLDDPRIRRTALMIALVLCSTGVLALFWPSAGRWSRFARAFAAVLGLCALAGTAYSMVSGAVRAAVDTRTLVVVAFANLAALITAFLVVLALRLLLAPERSDSGTAVCAAARVHYIVLGLAGLAATLILMQGNYIGYHF